MAETVDNLQSNPTSAPDAVTGSGFSSEDFFASLDSQVNQLLVDPPQQKVEKKVKETNSPPSNKGLDNELKNLEKRYADSSREAKRLNQRNLELEKAAPILDKMRQDPEVAGQIRDLVEGRVLNKSPKEALNLPEDFVFDADEAISNPNSDSGKVLSNLVDGQVQKRVSQFAQNYTDKLDKSRELKSFIQRHNMTKEQYEDFVRFANSRPLSLDDIYTLKNLSERDANIADNTRQEMKNQMENVRKQPASVASLGEASSTKGEATPDEIIFAAIKESEAGGLDLLQ